MSRSIQRKLVLFHPPEQVWKAIATREGLAVWLHPNNFEPRVGHCFQFIVPAKPEMQFEGLVVNCEVLECDPPRKLLLSWSAGGPVADTRVCFLLEPFQGGTRLTLEHSGFDISQPWAEEAVQGAEYGWAEMLIALRTWLGEASGSTQTGEHHL
jgi:uncharacterized protein YndB with AHSA1/START domain